MICGGKTRKTAGRGGRASSVVLVSGGLVSGDAANRRAVRHTMSRCLRVICMPLAAAAVLRGGQGLPSHHPTPEQWEQVMVGDTALVDLSSLAELPEGVRVLGLSLIHI